MTDAQLRKMIEKWFARLHVLLLICCLLTVVFAYFDHDWSARYRILIAGVALQTLIRARVIARFTGLAVLLAIVVTALLEHGGICR